MLKFKRVKPKFPDTSSNLVNTAPIIKARLIQDNYFRSLYRYDPHAIENPNEIDSKNRPRKVINYHKSLENLSDEFWRSVERAASPLGRRAMSPSRAEDSPAASNKSSTDDVSSGHSSLTVPDQTRPRSSTEIDESQQRNALRAEALRKLEIAEGRPRSQSEFVISKRFPEEGRREVYNERATYTLPSKFHVKEPTERRRSASDRSSEISLPFSDSCSESSGDSDQLTVGNPHSPSYRGVIKRWSEEENQNERLKIAEERLYNGLRRSEEQARRTKAARNPLENVIHWVIEPPKQEHLYRNQLQGTHANNTHHRKPDPPKRGDSSTRVSVQRGHDYNGQPPRLTKSTSSTAL